MTEARKPAVTCTGCGTVAPDDEVPMSWTFQTSERGATYLCPSCARDNIRSIEAKLDDAWW